MSNPNANSAPSRPRRKRKNNSLLVLAAGIFIFGAAAATLYYLLQPTTLRIEIATKARIGLEITTAGVATHGARPWLGHNAIGDMARIVAGLEGVA